MSKVRIGILFYEFLSFSIVRRNSRCKVTSERIFMKLAYLRRFAAGDEWYFSRVWLISSPYFTYFIGFRLIFSLIFDPEKDGQSGIPVQ